MNISRLLMCAVLFAPTAAIAGCATDTMPEEAGDDAETVGEAAQAVTGDPLLYGQQYSLLSQYKSSTTVNISFGFGGETITLPSAGGWLDIREAGCQGNKYCVSTATSPTRDGNSGTWMLVSASGKADGTPVANGDLVYLKNMYGGDGGYLDIRGAGCEGDEYCVSTASSPLRDSGSGTWQIQSVTGSATVTEGQGVYLANGYAGFTGGYLDVDGSGCQGNLLCAATSAQQDRDHGSTHWTFSAATNPAPGSHGGGRVGNGFRGERAAANGTGSLDTPEASYWRTGTIPSSCPSGSSDVGLFCGQNCPSGYTDTGLMCTYSDGPLTTSCDGWDWAGAHCASCPVGYVDAGAFCAAKSFDKANVGAPSCGADEEEIAGLCYTKCDPGYVGVLSVCWLGSFGTGACQMLYDPLLAQDAISHGTTETYGVGAGAEVVATGGAEYGVVYGDKGEYGCYSQWCAGIASNIGLSTWISFGEVDGGFAAASGGSYVAGISVGPEVAGYAASISMNSDGTVGGWAQQLSLGVGVLPVESTGAYCDTTVQRLW